jgi:hypothetical protein
MAILPWGGSTYSSQLGMRHQLPIRYYKGNSMFEKFKVWFGLYRKPIGYTIGTVNVLGGLQYFAQDNSAQGWLFFMIGYIILLDTWDN